MKKFILLLLIITATNSTIAQEVTKIPLAKEVASQWYTFKNADDTILVQNYYDKRDKEYLITILDSKQLTKKSHKLEHTEDILLNVSFADETVYFLFQQNRKSELQIDYYVKTVHISDFKGSQKVLFTAVENNSKTIRRYFKVRPNDIFGEVIFEDNFTAILYDIRGDETKTRTTYMFDENYNQIFKQAKTYPRKEKEQRFVHVTSHIDKANQSLITLNRKRDANNFKLERITSDGYTSKDFSFNKDGQRDLKIVGSKIGFHCVGFFYNEDKGVQDALFYASFSNDLEILEEKYIKLSEGFFNELNKKQKKRGMLLDLHSVLTDDDDSMYIIGEAQRIGVAGKDLQGFSNLYGIPDDVVVCKIDENATLLWSKLINKSQKFYHTHYASFRPFIIKNRLHYVFNSEMDLETVKTDKKSGKSMQPGSGQRFSVYLVSFNNDGAFEHFKLTDKKVDLRYMTTNSGFIEDESILLFGKRKKQQGILRIQI